MDGWRCGRADCRGTICDFGDGAHCLLCGRGPGNDNGCDPDPDPLIVALMTEPPGPLRSLRGHISEEMYDRPNARGRQAKWLAWEGWDGRDRPSPTTEGRGRGGRKAGEIRQLHYGDGLSLKEIIAEGQRRLEAGLPGWKANYARSVLRLQRLREEEGDQDLVTQRRRPPLANRCAAPFRLR